jgi:hypothetical protein
MHSRYNKRRTYKFKPGKYEMLQGIAKSCEEMIMSTENETRKHDLACDLAHELFFPSHALLLEDAPPERLYSELEAKGYTWTGSEWKAIKGQQAS